jgi:hypothetical protein
MQSFPLFWSSWTEYLPESIRGHVEGPVGLGILVVVLMLVVYVLADAIGSFFRAAPKGPEANLREDPTTYPHPRGEPGPRRLTIDGVPGRIRLIVIAPATRNQDLDQNRAEEMVNQVVRGMKEIIQQDRPRIRCWPPQLSHTGFAPSFHRLTEVPINNGEESQWVLIAGPANAAGKPILLGLAVLADEANELGKLTLTPEKWAEMVRVVTLEQ